MAQIEKEALQDLKQRIDIVELIGKVTALRRVGSTFRGPCPWCGGPKLSTKFEVMPARKAFRCHGCDASGDAVEFVRLWDGVDFVTAVETLGGVRELSPADKKKMACKQASEERQTAKRNQKKLEKARGIWDATVHGAGTLAEIYVRWRGIPIEGLPYGWPNALRLHENLDYWHQPKANKPVVIHTGPAVIGAIVGPDDAFMGAHCTWIKPDGRGKMKLLDDRGVVLPTKKIQGFHKGGAIRLTPGQSVGATHMLTGEGYETTLSALYAMTRAGQGPYEAWSAVSLGNMSGAGLGRSTPHPVDPKKRVPSAIPDPESPGLLMPDWVKRQTLLGDRDSDWHITKARMDCAARRAIACGVETDIAWADEGKDFNDMLVRP